MTPGGDRRRPRDMPGAAFISSERLNSFFTGKIRGVCYNNPQEQTALSFAAGMTA